MTGRMNTKKIYSENVDTFKKSNELSLSKISHGLTLNQMQLLAYAIYVTQKNNEETFIKADFERRFNITRYNTKEAAEDSEKLSKLQHGFVSLGTDKFQFINAFQHILYEKGVFEFKWTERMLPHVLNIQDKYILTDLTITSQFSSGFSWALYDYLKAKYSCWYITLTKEDAMKLFGVEEKKSYIANTGLLRRKVIDAAIKELNTYTEMEVKCENINQGKAIVGFKIYWSTGQLIRKTTKKQMETLKKLCDLIFEDALMYLAIKDNKNRAKASEIIRNTREIKSKYIDVEVGLRADYYTEIKDLIENNIKILNAILISDGKDPLSEDVPMFNYIN